MERYQNRSEVAARRATDLLARLSLSDKLGQLNIPCPLVLGEDAATRERTCQEWAAGRPPRSIGQQSQVGGFFSYLEYAGTTPDDQRERVANLQRIAVEESPHRIPLLFIDEGTHGLRAPGAPIYPEGLALGSTWNPGRIEEIYREIAQTTFSLGVHGLATLVVEPHRDPRIGRNQECFSEDRLMCADFAEAITRGLQGDGGLTPDSILPVLCHFPGQSAGTSGLERGSMPYSERTIRETFLPPWRKGVSNAGAAGVMATYAAIDGVPVHGAKRYLTEILRGELSFTGLVFSEGAGLESLIYEGIVLSQKEAGIRSILAGLDVSIWFESGFWEDLYEAGRSDPEVAAAIDRAALRILETKFRLGLFDTERAHRPTSATPTRLNEETAVEGMVLLKNENDLLPLSPSVASIAVVGPNADEPNNLLGDYTTKTPAQEIVTILDGIKRFAPVGTDIRYARGCGVNADRFDDIESAVTVASECDVAIVVVGENGWRAPQLPTGAEDTIKRPGRLPSNGEGYDAATLSLTGRQSELIQRVWETGTPIVLALVNGRPLAIPEEVDRATAVLECWIPGARGGLAAGAILFGITEPTGRLPVTFPRHAGQLPVHYDHSKAQEFWIRDGWLDTAYVDIPAKPLFHFGFGLGYTTFRVDGLAADVIVSDTATVGYDQTIVQARARLKNTGTREGTAVVQYYQRDLVSSVSTPVQRLVAYTRVTLKPGESTDCRVDIPGHAFSLVTSDYRDTIEAGEFKLSVGLCSAIAHDQCTIRLPSLELE